MVQVGPLRDQAVRSPRQLALDYFGSQNVYDGFILTVDRVEVRRGMIRPEHPDYDPIKPTNLRHKSFRGALGITPPETCPLALDKVNQRTIQFHRST